MRIILLILDLMPYVTEDNINSAAPYVTALLFMFGFALIVASIYCLGRMPWKQLLKKNLFGNLVTLFVK